MAFLAYGFHIFHLQGFLYTSLGFSFLFFLIFFVHGFWFPIWRILIISLRERVCVRFLWLFVMQTSAKGRLVCISFCCTWYRFSPMSTLNFLIVRPLWFFSLFHVSSFWNLNFSNVNATYAAVCHFLHSGGTLILILHLEVLMSWQKGLTNFFVAFTRLQNYSNTYRKMSSYRCNINM